MTNHFLENALEGLDLVVRRATRHVVATCKDSNSATNWRNEARRSAPSKIASDQLRVEGRGEGVRQERELDGDAAVEAQQLGGALLVQLHQVLEVCDVVDFAHVDGDGPTSFHLIQNAGVDPALLGRGRKQPSLPCQRRQATDLHQTEAIQHGRRTELALGGGVAELHRRLEAPGEDELGGVGRTAEVLHQLHAVGAELLDVALLDVRFVQEGLEEAVDALAEEAKRT